MIEYLVRTTLIAIVVALVLYALRIKTASIRHAVWSSVVLLMLLLPLWLAWGPRAPLPLLPREAVRPLPLYISQPSGAGLRPAATYNQPQPPAVWDRGSLFAGIYLLGATILLARLLIGTIRTIRLTTASCIVPVTVGFFRPRIILPETSSDWPPSRLDAVLIHEREHVRRRDPLFQWIALLNRALFWFHPLAWWLEREISGLAEEACDAAVLAHGHDAHDYSEHLLDLSRSVELAGRRFNVIGMAMPGAFLPQRIRRMLSGVPIPQISRARLACALTICAAAAAILAAGTIVRAQSQSEQRPSFEVATVKPVDPKSGAGGSKSGDGGRGGGGPVASDLQLVHGRLIYTDTLVGFIIKAYGIHSCSPRSDCALLSGEPEWAKKDRFEIQAKTPDGTPDYTSFQFSTSGAPQLYPMLQALLADRFNLKIHREQKQLPVYAITIGKNGPKLKKGAGEMVQSKDGSVRENRSVGFMFVPQPNGEFNGRDMQMIVRNRTLQELADTLSNVMDRPVLNRTGLEGEFDITMPYERDADVPDASDGAARLAQMFGPWFFTAFQEQLGLKLESTKAPIDAFVIDHVEQPSGN